MLYIRWLKTDQIRYISFLAPGLDSSGCMRWMRPVWLCVLVCILSIIDAKVNNASLKNAS